MTDEPNAVNNKMKSENIDELAKALIKVQAALKPVPRGSENPFFKSRYAELSACIVHAAPLLTKHGLAIVQTGEPNEGKGATLQTLLIHESGQWISGIMTVTPSKDDPQGYGSALTYLRRYGFMAIIGLAQEGDDDDAEEATHSAGKSEKHRPTKEYELRTAKSDPKSTAELLELSTWLNENNITEEFVLTMLKGKKLVPPGLDKLADAPPGVIQRTLASRERLLKAYETVSAAVSDKPKKTKAAPNGHHPEDEDQSAGIQPRQPVQDDVTPTDLLDQEGYEDWRTVVIHFGKQKGAQLGKIGAKSLVWWITNWTPTQYKGKWSDDDLILDAALCLAHAEIADAQSEGQ
jgi:hypothetical protein